MNKKVKRIFKYFIFSCMGIFIVLTGALAIHIYQVSNKPRGGMDSWQMARIDVVSDRDSAHLALFRQAVQMQAGVYHTYVNYDAATLSFAYNAEEVNADTVCLNAVSATGIPASRIKVNESDVANACPVIDKNSITYRISSGFQKLFNN